MRLMPQWTDYLTEFLDAIFALYSAFERAFGKNLPRGSRNHFGCPLASPMSVLPPSTPYRNSQTKNSKIHQKPVKYFLNYFSDTGGGE